MAPETAGADRLPPQSREAERSVLGSMLRDNRVISDVVQLLRAEDFYADAHQKTYQAIVTLHDKSGQPVDVVLLAEELKQRGQIEDVGGYTFLAELWDAAPTAANAEYYAKIVRDRALVRNLIHAGTEILRDAYDQAQPADDLVAQAEHKIFELAQSGVSGQTVTLQEALRAAYDRIDKNSMGGKSITGISTGYTDLDEITAGLQNEEVTIIAARPSVGKTSFALNLVRNIVLEENQSVFFVSLEQSRIELAERLLCCHARVDSHKVRTGRLTGDDISKLIEAGGELGGAKLFIDDNAGQGMLKISANARRLKMRHDLKLLVIDYLQLIEPDNRRDPRQEQVAQVSRRLKFLAKELKIPVVALAQVNRSSEERQDHRPRLADLRESGSIEQDADVVMMLHRPDRYEPGQNEGVVEIIVGKNRNGPTGDITLAYIKQYMRFENFAVGTPFEP
jgi:replicative DNA helicase